MTLHESAEMFYSDVYWRHTVRRARKSKPLQVLEVVREYRGCGCGEFDDDYHELVHVTRF